MGSLQVRGYDDTLNVPEQQLVNATVAPIFIGCIVATALWGVACAQSALYFRKHPHDSKQIKNIVIVILSLEAFHFAVTIHGVYFTVINCRMDIAQLNQGPVWSLLIQVLPSALIVAIVRYVWIMRIWSLSQSLRKNIISVAMIILVIVEAVTTVACMIVGLAKPVWGEVKGIAWPIVGTFFLRAFNDISMTALFGYYLNRSKNGFEKTDSVIKTMIYYGLGSGFFVCVGSISLIFVMGFTPTQMWFIAMYVALTRVYANSLMAMLNWRRPSGEEIKASEVDGIELSTVNWAWSDGSRLMDPEFHDEESCYILN